MKSFFKAKDGGKKKHKGMLAGLIVTAALISVLTTYVAFASQYDNKFLKGTTINGIDVSELTADEAESRIKSAVEDGYSLTMTFRGGETATLTSADIGLTYTETDEISDLLSKQDTLSWLGTEFGRTQDYTVSTAYTFDADKLKAALEALPELNAENVTAPVNAKMSLSDEGSFSITPETEGNEINEDALVQAVSDAIDSGSTSLDLESAGVYETPSVRSDDASLNDQVNDLNAFLDTTVRFSMYDGTTITLDRSQTKDWLATSDDDPDYYYINTDVLEEKCKEYVEDLASQYDTAGGSFSFASTNQGTVEVKAKTLEFGYEIDQSDTADELYSALVNKNSETLTPEYSVEKGENPVEDGTYIEVDIENQKVYYYENGELELSSDVVTGLAADSSRATPYGAYYIYSKQSPRDLKGPIDPSTGQPTYVSHVTYWMPFYEGYGLHDASWRSSFGGDIYLSHGSHGCVNLPSDFAAELYSAISVGTPVILV